MTSSSTGRPKRAWVHLVLLVLTALSTFTTFFLVFEGEGARGERILGSVLFSVSLLAILGAHEMGHYVYARRHGVEASLPYFIPAPLLGIGTFGAVIRIRSRIPNRDALVDIGAAGPLAGLALALPTLVVGYFFSKPLWMGEVSTHFPGEFSLWALARMLWSTVRHLSPSMHAVGAPVTIFGDNLLTLAVQHLVWGKLPPGMTLKAHPLVISGWFGSLVTMLNLLPIGQLDGGHLAHAVMGRRAIRLGQAVALGLFFLCVFASAGWVLWLLLTWWVVGFRHPEVVDVSLPMSRGRKWVCALCLLALVLCLMPVPVTQGTLP